MNANNVNSGFDQHAINNMTVAIRREMMPGERKRRQLNTLFMGGCAPTADEQQALARFGLDKNYCIIFPAFDPSDVGAGPMEIHAVVTDGLSRAALISNGRLWKRDRRSPAVLLFLEHRSVVKVTDKGRLVVNEIRGQYHDHGYGLAREAIASAAAKQPARCAVIAPVGSLITVSDAAAVAEAFALAE